MTSALKDPDPNAARLRQQGEAALQECPDTTPEPFGNAATRTLLHELRVHQVELESQNEELRRTQLERDTAQARFVDLYDLAPVGYCTVSETGMIVEANLTLAAMLGVVRGALTGRPFNRYLLPADQDSFYLLCHQLFASAQAPAEPPHICEWRMLRQGGEPFWAQLVVKVDRYPGSQGEGGAERSAMGFALTDISARKQTEEALRRSREQERVNAAALRVISQGVVVTRPDAHIVSANTAFLAITGYGEAEVLGLPCGFLEGPHTDPQMAEAMAAAMARQTTFAGEILHYRRDGTPFWNELTLSPLFDAGGTLTHFVAVIRDVTTHKRRQDEAHLRERRMTNAEALAEFGSWDWNLSGVGSTWSDKLFEIYGRDPALGVPAFDAWEETIHPDDRDSLATCIQQALATDTKYSIEFRIHTKDTGALRYISSRGVPKVDAEGKVVGIWGVDQDVTLARQAAQALQASLHEKEALLREVHHRVKNNLQVITSLLRLEAHRSVQPDTRAVLDEMQGRIRTMAVLHESLYHSGIYSSVDLGAYLRQLVGQVFRAHAPLSAQVQLQLDLISVPVAMDQATPCGLIVNELVSNSLKHGFPAGHAGEIRVVLQALAGTPLLQLQVSDTGVGLPDDFESRRKQSLGLQLVSDLASQIDGRLDAASGAGPGTCFTISFARGEPGARPPGQGGTPAAPGAAG